MVWMLLHPILSIQRDKENALLGLSSHAFGLCYFISAAAVSAGRKERKKLGREESRSSFPITDTTGKARNVLLKGLFPKVPWAPA